ncbi:sensor histidine kinase [Mycobacterium sp. PSTR-4-N]|uniref:sensor histidine kinase n=1 Tax=Mycobacterium sp. PSTR-4-N TaxID=2917745 RepID=UPI001F14B979|nr:sensor histidine kinase [Mycobacterium sp. PSTR-4-N]MCG7595918.1 response regulator [Mycobacterium sp. PSTR-4-N]
MELERGIDHRDGSTDTRLLMATPRVDSPDLRLRLNRGQWALVAVLVLLIGALIVNNYAVTAEHRRYSEAVARTETAGNNMFYTLSETLSYVDAFDRYLLGIASRREVQVQRALLAQRLAVVGGNGITAGDSTSPEYRAKLSELDDALTKVPPGFLPPSQRDDWGRIVLPRSDALSETSRRMADSATAELHMDARSSSQNLLEGRVIQLGMLLATLAVATVLLGWVATNVVRQYRGARAALDRERKTLDSTESQLARVSFLDRGQAEVLERIATGDDLPAVLRQIGELTIGASGQNAVRITTDTLSMTLPAGADVSAPPAWKQTFQSSTTDTAGTLEVFGDSEMLDDMACTAFLRCCDLASLALEHEDAQRAALILAEEKSNYVATVSHEIRAPLHAILGFSELMENQLSSEGRHEIAEWSRRVRTEADRLTRLIDDLLNLSRLNAGRTKIASTPFRLRKLLDDLIESVRITAESKGLTVNSSVDPTISDWRIGDPDRVHQVLLNLVSNATKFTRVGRIDIEISSAATETAPDLVRFAVNDTGPGIPREEIDRVLQPFAQVSGADSDRGSGLGLAISDGIVKALGGDGLAVVSLEGHGSTFHFTLPLPETAPPEPAPYSEAEPATDGSLGTILVVDDNPTNQVLVEAQLKRLGYVCEAAFDGAEALERLGSGRFDAVLMDCNMPVMDGYMATRRIRAEERGSGVHIPILALTASTMEGNRDACERAGMDGFLTKPLHLADLSRELGRFLGQRPEECPDREPLTSGPVQTVGGAPLLDDVRIDRMLAELGEVSLQKVARSFVTEMPRRLDDLHRAAAAGDADAVRRSAHAIRSPGAMLGASALAERFRAIEESDDPVACVADGPLAEIVDATVERLRVRLHMSAHSEDVH